MQDVKKAKMKTLAFILTCGSDKETVKFSLERINKLSKEKTDIEEILVYFVVVDKKAAYLRSTVFRKTYLDTLTNFKYYYVTGKGNNATPPRACNYGLDAALDGPADYFVFLNDNDIIMDKNLLQYYKWLFDTAHNPDVIGAVSFSSNAAMGKPAPNVVKMFYADDVYLRGTCIKREAAINTGPFDELLLTSGYEVDFFNRMTHHNGWLVRLGKEENSFIKLSEDPVSSNHEKLRFVRKQSLVWFARKWQNKGIWPDEQENGVVSTCFIRKNTFYDPGDTKSAQSFFDKFVLTEAQIEATRERLKILYEDESIKNAVKVSECFIKKPIGNFTKHSVLDSGVKIYNKRDILTHVACNLEYWDTLQWKPKEVY
jgi:hypothetical protein